MPVTGFHSTMESPDSVSRVAPPTSTISAISVATPISHQRTAVFWDTVAVETACMGRASLVRCAPYSPTPPRRKLSQIKRIAHFRHDDPHPKILWRHRAGPAGRGVVAARHGHGADACYRGFRRVAGGLLCGGRTGLGAAGDADRQLDAKA